MPHNLRLDTINDLNLLKNLAGKGLKTFPNEICLFLSEELNLKSAAIFEETSPNEFKLIGKSSSIPENFKTQLLSIENYNSIAEDSKFEFDYSTNCKLLGGSEDSLQSIVFKLDEYRLGIILLFHKVVPSSANENKYLSISKLTADLMEMWNRSTPNFGNNIKNITEKLLIDSIKSFIKEIKTIDGLISLSIDETVSKKVKKNIQEIKLTNNFLVASFSDLISILEMNDKEKLSKTSIVLSDFISDVIETIKVKTPKCPNYKITNVLDDPISFDKQILSNILQIALQFSGDVSNENEVLVQTSLNSENNLHIGIVSKHSKLNRESIKNIFSPFRNKEFLSNISGLGLSLLAKYIEVFDGTVKIYIEKNDLHLNISLPIGTVESIDGSKRTELRDESSRDKILVIESDNASTALLNNYLSKWNYQTKFVSSGVDALNLLNDTKYVAVILNIEQENDNSLELLQKIKNNHSTRNTPVIVFTLEAEKDKIYLMGSVEYLVKPINYNNLVEILTSYKLRRNSKVLCVDDDQPTLNLLKQAVQTAGFNVVSEYRPELVLELIRDKDLDLAIIDLDMPKLNGFDLIKSIKSIDKFSKLPIVIYTGKEDYQEDLQKIDGMFVDLLDKKSTSFNELENTISAMINSYEDTKSSEELAAFSDSPKILMAEDYKHSQIIVRRLLKKSGFENVIIVENGEEALKICEKEKIDLILMDMQMPVMNGFEATGKIRELDGYADTPIISLTAFAMKGDREKCLESGATDYVPKPIDSKEFIEKVKYYTQVKVES